MIRKWTVRAKGSKPGQDTAGADTQLQQGGNQHAPASGEAPSGWIQPPVRPEHPFSDQLEDNIAAIQHAIGPSPDVILRRFQITGAQQVEAALFYIEGLAETTMINASVLGSLFFEAPQTNAVSNLTPQNALVLLKERAVAVGNVKEAESLEEALYAILEGECLLLLEGNPVALRLETTGFEARGVEPPMTEVVVRGSREGFCETLQVNISLLRRRLRTPDLRIEKIRLGERSGTTLCVAYIKGLAQDKLVEEVRRRLRRIRIDGVLESGYIENLIEDNPLTLFPTIGNTEKPDTAAAKLLEGRLAILVDGTPFVLTLPYLFVEIFQVTEDYYSRPFYATLVRWIRYLAFAITLTLPAFIVAVKTFHVELLPPALMLTMAANREGIPFPVFMEAAIMALVFEVLREAGVRLPRPVGQAISIVGALVMGESAVRAGLVSNTMVVVIAFTAIAGFLLPPIADPVGILRYPLLFLGASMGLPGLTFGLLGMLTLLAGIRSFGVPYLSPLAPASFPAWKDVVYRSPWWAMTTRPPLLGDADPQRMTKAPQRPGPRPGGRRQP